MENKYKFALGAVAIAAIIVVAYIVLQQPFETIEKEYEIKAYPGLSAAKRVSITSSWHTEEILLKSDSERLEHALIFIIPKVLAKTTADIRISTNGTLIALKNDPIIGISAKEAPNEILAKIEIASGAKDICAIAAIMPLSFLGGLDESQNRQFVERLSEFDMNLNCADVENLENKLSEELQNAFEE